MDRLPLYELESQARTLTERMNFLGQEKGAHVLLPLWQMTLNFMGQAAGLEEELSGAVMKECDIPRLLVETGRGPGADASHGDLCKMILAYHFSKFEKAVASCTPTLYHMYKTLGTVRSGLGRFYECLALLETLPSQRSLLERRRRLRRVQSHLKVFRYWAKHCPENIMGKLCLIRAEMSRYRGDVRNAQLQYYCSIIHAREGGSLLEHALANERAGKFEMELGNLKKARECVGEAIRLYQAWGGIAKVNHLVNEVGKSLRINNNYKEAMADNEHRRLVGCN